MTLSLKSGSSKNSENCIFLLHSRSQLKASRLSKPARKWFDNRFVTDEINYLNEDGKVTVVCKIPQIASDDDREFVRKLGHTVYKTIGKLIKDVFLACEDAQTTEVFAEGMLLADYQFDKYLSKKPKITLGQLFVASKMADLGRLKTVVKMVNWARDLVNEPVSWLNATKLSEEIATASEKAGVDCEIFGKQKIESLKMGGLLAVNKGSVDPPTFTTLEWKPENRVNKKPVVLIGKGIVFDTGGLSLKPTKDSMDLMKCDMAGAASVAAVTLAIARLRLPLHVIALIPATDNRPGGNAYAPGDIVTMHNGKTVEVLNTDAEGRMALADALSYSSKFEPELVIDVATLTGSAARAFGVHASVTMGNAPQKEFDLLNAAGFYTCDRVVQVPFWDEYEEYIKSPIADLKNVGGPEAGMITAGKFLAHFTKYPYIHIDIAGPAFVQTEENYRGLGATGASIRLLIEFLSRRISK